MHATAESRGSTVVVQDYCRIMDIVRNSAIMQKQWESYQRDFEYAADILFKDTCDTVVQLMNLLMDT